MSRRTRIVATLGPATDPPGVLEAMLHAGLDVARINFAHGSPGEHRGRIERLRHAMRDLARPVAILADLPGPKLRVRLAQPLLLEPGQTTTLGATPDAVADIRLTEPEVARDMHPKQRVLLDDGRLQLRVIETAADRVLAEVEVGGTLLPGKGLNLPDTRLSIPALGPRDRMALAVALATDVDWIGLSFVRSPDAAEALRSVIRSHGKEKPVLAKIERPEAVYHAREIIEAFDGVMVARGDLGVEMPLERVPHIQKRLINQARAAGKPVVTATDMLDSMRLNPRPTRAEASDVANAIYDGTDAVMLSGETAVGQHPIEAVKCMDRICRATEADLDDDGRDVHVPRGRLKDHITHSTCALAREVGAKAIVTPTYSGRTPQLIARHRPIATVVAASCHAEVVRQLALVWGVVPVMMPSDAQAGQDRLEAAVRAAHSHQAVRTGDLVVVLAEHPVEGGDRYPTIRVVGVGDGGRSVAP